MQTDEELMLAYKQGSEAAFVELYEKYSPLVYGYIKKRLRASEAEDFYQKVWRQLHEKRGLFEAQPFAPWFFVLIRNLLIDEYRALGRRQKHEHYHELLEQLYGQLTPEHDLEEILGLLPPDTASLVRKYYIEGVSYEELEKTSGLSHAGLRQRLSRAIRGLRAKLQGVNDEA